MLGAVQGMAEVLRLELRPGLVEALAGRLVLAGEARRHALLIAQPQPHRVGLLDHRPGRALQRLAVVAQVKEDAQGYQPQEHQQQTPALQGLHRDAVPILPRSISLLDGLGGHLRFLSCRDVNITRNVFPERRFFSARFLRKISLHGEERRGLCGRRGAAKVLGSSG